MKKTILFFFAICALLTFSFAQDKIKFEEVNHDFGVKQKGDPTDFTFVFTNIDTKEVALKSVKASCGCTTPNWTSTPVKPNEKGEIAVSYDSKRIGQFTKSITVVYDSTQQPVILTIKGEIKDVEALEENHEGHDHAGHDHAGHDHSSLAPKSLYNYSFPQGALSFEKVAEEVGVLNTDKTHQMTFRVKNTGKETVTFGEFAVNEKVFTNIQYLPKSLLAGQEGVIHITLDGSKATEFGRFSKDFILNTDDKIGAEKRLTITGEFNKVLTEEEKANAPKISFQHLEYNAGAVIAGEKVVHKYVFTNTGKSDLIIESAKGSCGCTVAEPKEKVIKPGQSSEITATFDSSGRIGENIKTITVKSNDPMQENVQLKLTTKVESDPFHAGEVGPSEKK